MQDTSPQLENGYTRLANELLDALIGAGLTARQWAVVMAIVRKTYGFQRKTDDIGLSQLRDMTGIDRAHLSRTVRELEAMKLITRSDGRYVHTLGINKNIRQWVLPNQQQVLPNQQQVLPKEQQLPNQQQGYCRISNRGIAERATTKERFKERIKENKPKPLCSVAARAVRALVRRLPEKAEPCPGREGVCQAQP